MLPTVSLHCLKLSQASRILPGGDLSAANPVCLAGKGLVLLASSRFHQDSDHLTVPLAQMPLNLS